MSRRTQENIAAAAFLAVFAGAIWLALDFGPRARMIPLPLATFGVVLALVQLVWQNLGSTEALKMDLVRVRDEALPAHASGEEPDRQPSQREPRRSSAARAYGIVAAILVLILALGPLPAVFLFTAGYLALSRYCAWLTALLWATATAAVVHVLFFVALQIQPYHGLLAPLLASFD